MKNTPPNMIQGYGRLPGYGSVPKGQPGGYGRVNADDMLSIDGYDSVTPADWQNHFALVDKNQQMAPQRAREIEFWRQRTLARQQRMQNYTQDGPDTKALSDSQYALEAMDPKHRIGELLNVFLDEYNRIKPGAMFLDWVDSMTPMNQVKVIQRVMEARGHEGVVKPEWVRAFNRGVRYMSAAERGSYQVQINGGLLYQNGELLDTGNMRTEFSGDGVAIFVQDETGIFYSSSHVWGRLHHSSFTSGAAVRSAGEWKVKHGKIQWLSGKSGHYKPTMTQFINALTDLKASNALLGAKAWVYDILQSMDTTIDANMLIPQSHYFKVWG